MATEIVRRFLQAVERQDLDAAIRCLDRGVYFVSTGEDADFSAHEGFRRWWELWTSSGSDLHPLRVEALDDHHVFAELLSGHPESGGRSWAGETLGCVFTVGDGVIEAVEMFANPEIALERARRAIEVLRPDGE